MNTEKEKFLKSHQKKVEKGLKGIHLTLNPNQTEKPTEEDLYAELNRIEAAPDLPDPEVLGKCSP